MRAMTSEKTDLSPNWLGALGALVAQNEADAFAGQKLQSADAALLSVFHFPGLSPTELASILAVTVSGSVRLLNSLEARGLVVRTTGADARSRSISLTAEGERQARALREAREQALSHLLEALSASERDTFARLTSRILAHAPLAPDTARHVCRLCNHTECDGPKCPVGSRVRATTGRAPRTGCARGQDGIR